MKIAIVSLPYLPIPPNRYGGTEQIVAHVVQGLQELGHEPILLAPGDSTIACQIIPICAKSIPFPKTKTDKEAHDQEILKATETTKSELHKLINSGGIDIIHSHGFDLFEFKDFPNLTTLHGPINLENMDYFLQRKELFYASISENQQHTCPELNYVQVVYNGLDVSKFPYVETPQDYVCFLGRFDREKNPHLAIQLALKAGIKIKLGGKIDFVGHDYFTEEIEPHLTNPLVEYLGELNFEQKVELVSHSKCNLHPTGFREPFGLSIVEAAYCGTPTLSIAKGSMSELIEHERTGVLVEDFAEGYNYLQKCFDMNREYISTRSKMLFNYKTMCEGYINAYKKVIEKFELVETK